MTILDRDGNHGYTGISFRGVDARPNMDPSAAQQQKVLDKVHLQLLRHLNKSITNTVFVEPYPSLQLASSKPLPFMIAMEISGLLEFHVAVSMLAPTWTPQEHRNRMF